MNEIMYSIEYRPTCFSLCILYAFCVSVIFICCIHKSVVAKVMNTLDTKQQRDNLLLVYEERYYLCSSRNVNYCGVQTRGIRWARHITHIGEFRITFKRYGMRKNTKISQSSRMLIRCANYYIALNTNIDKFMDAV
jgi:hypothetical protein